MSSSDKPRKFVTGKEAVISINGEKVKMASNVTFNYNIDNPWPILTDPVSAFMDLLGRTGIKAARDYLKHPPAHWSTVITVDDGSDFQPGDIVTIGRDDE